MRGDLAIHARLLLRPRGINGLVGTIAAASALAATYLAWYEVRADVAMLGSSQDTAVASLAGWQAHPWGWLAPAVSIVAIIAAIGVAIDRPARSAGRIQLGCGSVLASIAALGALVLPPVSRFDIAGSRLRELAGLAERLPSDVEMTFATTTAAGLWVMLAAAALLVASGLAERQL
jgi:cytochrome bd-type quinol oxidase subunit 2